MNIKKIVDTYQILGEISDYGPDIFGSEYSRNCLEKAGVPEQDAASALLRMQMEQERLSRIPMWHPSSYSAEEGFSTVRRNVVSELQKRLAHYTQEQQRGICLFMRENIDSVCGHTCTEQQRLQWARLPMEQLMELTAEGILQCVGRLFEENAQQLSRYKEDAQPEGGVFNPIASRSAAAAATAVAVYAECPEYRSRPEWVAQSTYIVQDPWKEDAEFISFMLLILSAVLLLSVLYAGAISSVVASIGAVSYGVELSWAGITAEFVAFIDLFKAVLLIGAGVGIAGLLVSAEAKFGETPLRGFQIAEAARRNMCIEKSSNDMRPVHQTLKKEDGDDEDDDDPDKVSARERHRA